MDRHEPVSLRQAWIGSIAGWTFLLTASLLFAAVILAPKILTYTKLQHDLADRNLRLVMIEDAVQRAENIAATLERESVRSLPRQGLGQDAVGEEIALPPELSLQTEVKLVDQLTPPPAPYPWYTSLLIELTVNRGLTTLMLLGAALLTVLSFLTSDGHPLRESSGSLWQLINRRYTPPEPATTEGVVPRPKFATHEKRSRTATRTPFSGPTVRSDGGEG